MLCPEVEKHALEVEREKMFAKQREQRRSLYGTGHLQSREERYNK